jgi:RNA polymerase-interacting CarD/CdnL/TRCF family regulator
MTLRVPTAKARASGLRALAETGVVSKALTTLKGRARVKRTMWSRRAQEYEAKINSGDLVSIAEVVRDLHRAENQPEQSYSERQLYEIGAGPHGPRSRRHRADRPRRGHRHAEQVAGEDPAAAA